MALTKVRFPETIQLGDVTKIDGAKIPPVDIICSGSPCQSLSVAGKREGLKGESGLFFYKTDIIRRMREATGGKYPRFLVWENVPGALNSSGGDDFRAVLEAIAETEIPVPEGGKWANAGLVQCDRCEIAWRILDAQYFGLAQRRARIFLVADFTTSERRAGKILFVEPSGGGDSTQSEGEGQTVAGCFADSAGDASAYGVVTKGNGDAFLNERTHTALSTGGGQAGQGYPCVVVRDRAGKPGGGKGPLLSVEKSLTLQANTNDPIVLESNQNHATITDSGVCPTLSAAMGMGGGHIPSIVFEPGVATRDGGHIYTDDKAPTLRANPGDNFPTVACAAGFKGEQGSSARGLGYKEEQAPTLTGNTPAVVYGICSKDSNSMKSSNPNSGFYEADIVRTLDTGGANPNRNQGGNVVVYPIEGNGSRPSHRGPGWSDSDKMFTLNATEQHAVAQVSTTGGQSETLYDVTHNGFPQISYGTSPTLTSRMGTGGNQVPILVESIPSKPMSTTGAQVWTTSKASFMTNWTEDQAQTLVATDWKDAPVVVTENKDEGEKMESEKETFEKALSSLLYIDNYCHSRHCEECPFYRMSFEGDCPLDKLSLGEKVYMETVKDKAEKRIDLYLKGKFDKEYWGSYWEE